jgi:hypothetical protein
MEKSSDGFVRADQIDLKSLDEQLERHLNRAWTMEKNKKKEEDTFINNNNFTHSNSFNSSSNSNIINVINNTKSVKKERQEWEIDPAKLIIKTAIARGTFGTVHRGFYDGHDVAGHSLSLTHLLFCLLFLYLVVSSLIDYTLSKKFIFYPFKKKKKFNF